MAAKNNWSVKSLTKGYCPLGEDPTAGITESCVDFNKATLAQVLQMKPDVVITTSTRTNAQADVPEQLDPSWVNTVRTLNDAGIEVVAIRDTPRLPRSAPDCLQESPGDFIGCGATRAGLFSEVPPTDAVASTLPNTKFLDFTNYFCNDTTCPAVIGNVIVYKDDNHPTKTYMESLEPVFAKEFQAATGWSMSQ